MFFIADVPASMQKDSALTAQGKDWKVEEKNKFFHEYVDRKKG